MPIIKNLLNQKFGKLIVTSEAKASKGRKHWNCLCECGNEKIVAGKYLSNGEVKSCGCLKYPSFKSMIGKKSEMLTVISITENRMLQCKCDCGNDHIIATFDLGRTLSCGCLTATSLRPGDKFNKLTLIFRKNGFWNCKCDCGKNINAKIKDLKSEAVKSCGCDIG